MIRSFLLADVIRLLRLQGIDWVSTPQSVLSKRSRFSLTGFLRDRSWLRRRGGAWIALDRGRVQSIVSARPSAGPSCWRVDHLVTAMRAERGCCDVLDAVAAYAGQQGAERLFLPVPDHWQILGTVRHVGFTPCMSFFLFTLPGRRPLLSVGPFRESRRRRPEDDQPLFRLYNATTPAGVRSAVGVTMHQWRDAQEPSGRGTRELVLEQHGLIRGWVRLAPRGRWVGVRTAVHPEWEGDLRPLVALVLERTAPRPVLWEVPTFDLSLRTMLERVGFELVGCYQLLVRPLAVPVRKPALVPAKVV